MGNKAPQHLENGPAVCPPRTLCHQRNCANADQKGDKNEADSHGMVREERKIAKNENVIHKDPKKGKIDAEVDRRKVLKPNPQHTSRLPFRR